MKSKNTWLIISGVLGFLGVAIGAFGAHSLKPLLGDNLTTYQTGVQYHLIHAVVLLVLSFKIDEFRTAAIFFLSGIILFSFSLYIYSIFKLTGFAIITPFGGICFLIGWGLIVVKGIKMKSI